MSAKFLIPSENFYNSTGDWLINTNDDLWDQSYNGPQLNELKKNMLSDL